MRRVVLGMVVAALCACGPLPEQSQEQPDDGGVRPSSRDAGRIFLPGDAGTSTPDAGPPAPRSDGFALPGPGEFPALQKSIPKATLTMDPGDLTALEANTTSDTGYPVTMSVDGQTATGTIRLRGASTRTYPQKSYKIELDPGQSIGQRDHFELLAEWQDAGKLGEKFAVDLHQAMGIPTPSARYLTLEINGRANGLYLDMEHVGKDFLRFHALESDASIYREGGRNGELTLQANTAYQDDWEKKTNETLPWDDMNGLEAFINRSDDAVFEQQIAKRLDLEAYLSLMAANELVSPYYVEDTRKYWVHELAKDRWSVVPWDLNNAFVIYNRQWKATEVPETTRENFVFSVYDGEVQEVYDERVAQNPAQRPTWSVLNTRIWDRPALRDRVIAKIEAALNGPFLADRATAHLDALWSLVGLAAAADPYSAGPTYVPNAATHLKDYIHGRRDFLQKTLPQMRNHGREAPLINELGFGDPSQAYVELYNPTSQPIDLGGRAITDDLRAPKKQILAAGLVVPAHGWLRLVADGNPAAGPDHLAFTLSTSGGELGLFDGTSVWGPSDVVYFGPHAKGTAYGRLPDGTETFQTVALTPGAANH